MARRSEMSTPVETEAPEFAVQVRELGFDELVINPPWEDLAQAEALIGQVKTTVSTSGAS